MENEDIMAMAGVQRVFRARYKLDRPGLISHITPASRMQKLIIFVMISAD